MILLILSCEGPQPRRPVEVKSGSFLKLSAERNKKLLQMEESLMEELAGKDSLHEYLRSSSGFRYYYNQELPGAGYRPKPDDLVTLAYNLRTWNEDTLYRQDEIGIIRYKVDKQELFPGLRYAVKLLKEGERATFLFPSSMGFGYHGDDNRIGPNVPLKATLEILKIEPQP
ncbi:MAG: gliding motility-associated peptidyl-prolyl isomerase GldI [Robiginitalea sp.]|jgi:gliding motility-associated peptidyl-prolyl isomerase